MPEVWRSSPKSPETISLASCLLGTKHGAGTFFTSKCGWSSDLRIPANSTGSNPDWGSAAIPCIGTRDQTYKCEYCEFQTTTKRGLGVHKSKIHPVEWNIEKLRHVSGSAPGSATRSSERDIGNETVERTSSRRLWSMDEMKILAQHEVGILKSNPNLSGAALNRELQSKMIGRSADAIKGKRAQRKYLDVFEAVRLEIESETMQPTSDEVAIENVETDEIGLNSMGDANSASGSEAREGIEFIAMNSEEPQVNMTDESEGPNAQLVDYLKSLKLSSGIRKKFGLERLTHIIHNMPKDKTVITRLLENWLSYIFSGLKSKKSNSVDNRSSKKPKMTKKKPKTILNKRGKKKGERIGYARIQSLWKVNRKKATALVLEDRHNSSSADCDTAEMLGFWSKVYEGDVNRKRVTIPDSHQTDPNTMSLWSPITVQEIIASELKRSTAPGPDSVTATQWRVVPREIRALFYTILMHCGIPLESLNKARTIFIPKTDAPKSPGEYRPISITSVIQRQFHKILAKRLASIRPFDDRQTAFRKVDGVASNLYTLKLVLEDAKRSRKELHLLLIDILKAFDSVAHRSIINRLSELGLPWQFVNYMKNVYDNARTTLMFNDQSLSVRMSKGVFQGCPLSPIIFNLVIDKALSALRDDFGYKCGDQSINAEAFADDIALLSSTAAGLQRNLDFIANELGCHGLQINHAKCSALSIIPLSHQKTTYIQLTPLFKVSGKDIEQIGPTDEWKYLGIRFKGADVSNKMPNIDEDLSRISKAPLKPQQKLCMLSQYVLTKQTFQAVLGDVSKEELRRNDIKTREAVRKWLHLPKDIPNACIHAPIRLGGLGVTSMSVSTPYNRYTRANRFVHSGSLLASEFEKSRYYQTCSSVGKEMFSEKGLNVDDGLIKYFEYELEKTIEGKDLAQFLKTSGVRSWVGPDSHKIAGRDFVTYNRVAYGCLPSLERLGRGREGNTLCRAGCGVSETNFHVIQACHRTHGGRVLRHNRVVEMAANMIEKSSNGRWKATIEPQLDTVVGLRKPDLILNDNRTIYVIDVQITGKNNLAGAKEEKIAKYRNIPNITSVIKAQYGGKKVVFGAIVLSYIGQIEESCWKLLKKFDLSKENIFRMVTSVLRGSWLNWFCFNRDHYQGDHGSRPTTSGRQGD